MFRDGLPRHGQPLAETGGGAVPLRQKQVEYPPTGRVPDRGPQVVVDGGDHGVDTSRSTYSPSLGTKVSQPVTCSACCSASLAADQPISLNPVSVSRIRVP